MRSRIDSVAASVMRPRTEAVAASVRHVGLLSGLLSSLLFGAATASAQMRLNFVSCPIVRDTATVPCWLTEYEGELYYMGIQSDVSAEFQPPYLGHEVLVEAVVASDRTICGGIVLEPIKISVMPELDGSCNTVLPAESRYVIDFNPRPPGPSGGRLAYAGPAAAPEVLEPPYAAREFELTFDFDRAVSFRHPAGIQRIADYAERIGAARILVHGSRGETLLSNGRRLTESAPVAERRATEVAALLRSLNLGAEIVPSWASEPVAGDGVDDWRSRSVTVRVVP